jgi:hypothetical protein
MRRSPSIISAFDVVFWEVDAGGGDLLAVIVHGAKDDGFDDPLFDAPVGQIAFGERGFGAAAEVAVEFAFTGLAGEAEV